MFQSRYDSIAVPVMSYGNCFSSFVSVHCHVGVSFRLSVFVLILPYPCIWSQIMVMHFDTHTSFHLLFIFDVQQVPWLWTVSVMSQLCRKNNNNNQDLFCIAFANIAVTIISWSLEWCTGYNMFLFFFLSSNFSLDYIWGYFKWNHIMFCYWIILWVDHFGVIHERERERDGWFLAITCLCNWFLSCAVITICYFRFGLRTIYYMHPHFMSVYHSSWIFLLKLVINYISYLSIN